MAQTQQDLDDWYSNPDPWGYYSNSDDLNRKRMILDATSPYAPFKRALDIGCGEGFITKDLPAKLLEGVEISNNAASRLPKKIKRVAQPEGKYDLIVCSGMLYNQYDHHTFLNWIKDHANGVVVTCNIKDWEINTLPSEYQVHQYEFPYRTYTQMLRVYKWPE